jgi:predicted lipoprotein with Yx(FWY)xxD motif
MTVVLVTVMIVATGATARTSAHAAKAKPVMRIGSTIVGPLLVNKSGRTIYMFTRDKRRKDKCRKIKGCEKDWPAVTTTGKPVAGPGVKKSLLGTIPYKGKQRELTYKGYPLHTYRYDTSKESVINIGLVQYGGSWYALNAKGGLIK